MVKKKESAEPYDGGFKSYP